MGLRAGCLSLAVEVERYTGVLYRQRVCRLCVSGEVEEQAHVLINYHKLNCIRQKLFSHCLTLSNHLLIRPQQRHIPFYVSKLIHQFPYFFKCIT